VTEHHLGCRYVVINLYQAVYTSDIGNINV